MTRRFLEHDFRRMRDLRGIWDFEFLGPVEPDCVAPEQITYSDRMAVPACFNATPAYAGKRGLAAYRTRVQFADALPHRIVLDGVHHWCRIFVDGKPLRDHAGGFTRFAVDLTPDAGVSELVVLVDNRFGFDRCLLHQEHYDWYQFGGITRGVEVHSLGTLWIDDLRISTQSLHLPAINLNLSYGAVQAPGRVPLIVTCDGRPVLEENLELSELRGRIKRVIELPAAKLWSPREPHLHQIHVRLGEDDRRERIGLRQIRVEGERLLINEEPVRLHGFNRHEFHPQFGHALPEAVLVADIQQLRDLGCNFVRGSHYPQDLRFLDLCDETGICVWSEAIGWQNTQHHLTDEQFIKAQLAQLEEMVDTAANRPSVILWGVLNEGHSHQAECRPAYNALLSRLRELDGTRPVTYASNQPYGDQCFDLADIISINTYPGWYWGSIAEIAESLTDLLSHLDSSVVPAKLILISEIGAGAVPGWRDWNKERWTEDYQAQLLEEVIRYFAGSPRICGLSIWLFNDFRTPDLVSRPRSYNDKGVVDEYRRPKMAYQTVKQAFRALQPPENRTKNP
jgi:beta-glucuronidase